jgi:dihydropteroate synthase
VPGLPVRDRTLVMGIVNVTPDSFSDGGAHVESQAGIEHGLLLASQGADIIDVGGESTRPGAGRVPIEVELDRVVPVVRALADAGLVVSVDTTRARVAQAALSVGAAAVNDVSGGLADPDMAGCVAQAAVPFIAMHWRGPSATMQRHTDYRDVVATVAAALRRRVDALIAAGVDRARIVLDPGLGFAKLPEHNWQLLARLPELQAIGRPILLGASRKAFLGAAVVVPEGQLPPAERDAATAAVSALAAHAGVYCVRVHDVKSTVQAVRVAQHWAAPPVPPGSDRVTSRPSADALFGRMRMR